MKMLSASAVAMSVVLATTAAQADILATATNVEPQGFTAGEPSLVVLDGNDDKSTIRFKTSKAGPVVVAFYAECRIAGAPEAYVDIDILVDPAGSGGFAPIPPTNDDNAMCTGHEGFPGPGARSVSAVTAGVINLPKGNHKVRVSAKYVGGEGAALLDDLLLVVEN